MKHLMKNLRQMTDQPQHLIVRLALVATLILIVSLAPTAAFAAPPATVASCVGIQEAYPVLGAQCKNAYERINHAPGKAKDRLKTFGARVAVLEIFKKASLCNGIYKADKTAQARFNSAVDGHLTALDNLHQAMSNHGDSNIPNAYTKDDLNSITIKKQQCV